MTLLKEMNFDSLEMPNERLESTYIQQGETTLSNNIEEKYSNKSFPLKNTTVGDLSTPHRELVDIIEIVYLSVIIVVGTVLNLIVLVRFMRQKRSDLQAS
jgi:hypothetical protein